MKTVIRLLSFAAIVALLAGCAEKETTQETESSSIEISSSYFTDGSYSYSLTKDAATDVITITCEGAWKVFVPTTCSDWISASKLNGSGNGSVTMSFSQNSTGEDRSGNFYVSAIGGKSINVSVSQTSVMGNSPVTCNYPYDLMLVYQGDKTKYRTYTSDDYLKFFLSNSDMEGGRQWLYDGILPLSLTYDGRALCNGYADNASVKSDWEGLLDYYVYTVFPAIEEAAIRAGQEMGEFPRKIRVVPMCPTPQDDQHNWGAVDGVSLHFDKVDDRLTACKWYVDELIDKYIKADFKNIELAGIYWFEEGLHSDLDMIKDLADHIHSKGTEFYWIPYYALSTYSHASIYDWKTYGFDRVYYQPNYYFYDVPASQVSQACSFAAAAGFYNMEVEFEGNCLVAYTSDYSTGAAKLREYLKTFKANGFESNYLVAYYEGGGAFLIMTDSIYPTDKTLYGELAGFVAKRQKHFYDLK